MDARNLRETGGICSLKVLLVCTSESWGGMEMHVGSVASALGAQGCTVAAICAPSSRMAIDLEKRGIPAFTIPSGGYIRPGAIYKAAIYLKQFVPDIVHVHFSRDLWWLVPAVEASGGAPIILSKHIGTQKPKRDFLHRLLYSRIDYIVAISEIIRENIIATHPVRAEQVLTVHHGIDLARFAIEKVDRQAVRKSLGYSDCHVVIGMMGRLQPSKGYYEFLEMASNLVRERDGCKFLIVGEASRGEEKEALEIRTFAQKQGLVESIQFTGFREDVPAVLAAMDIFMFPSHAEAFGLGLIEAMAMRRPVIASNCDGVLDIVIDGESGLLVAPKDAGALTRGVVQLLDAPALRKRLAAAARARVEKLFSKKMMIQKLCDIYRKVVDTAQIPEMMSPQQEVNGN